MAGCLEAPWNGNGCIEICCKQASENTSFRADQCDLHKVGRRFVCRQLERQHANGYDCAMANKQNVRKWAIKMEPLLSKCCTVAGAKLSAAS